MASAVLIGLDQRHENVELVALCVRLDAPSSRFRRGRRDSLSYGSADLPWWSSLKSGNSQSIYGIVFSMRPDKLDEHDLPAEVE